MRTSILFILPDPVWYEEEEFDTWGRKLVDCWNCGEINVPADTRCRCGIEHPEDRNKGY